MKNYKYLLKLILVIISLNTFFTQGAYAYIDPGTGSYMFQVAIAAILGTSFAIKSYWQRISNFFLNLLISHTKKSDGH